jgi:hypothetical protein
LLRHGFNFACFACFCDVICDVSPFGRPPRSDKLWTVRECLNCHPLRLKLNVGVAPEHSRADVPSDVHDYPVGRPWLAKGRNSRMSEVMESQPGQRTPDVAHLRLALRVLAELRGR